MAIDEYRDGEERAEDPREDEDLDEQEPPLEEILSSIRSIVSDGRAAGEPLTPDPASDENGGELQALTERLGRDERAAAAGPAEFGTGESPGPEPEPLPPPAAREPEDPPAAAGRLISPATEAASVGAFAALIADKGRAGSDDENTRAKGRGRTVEQLAEDVLRPMLREWMDANLPTLVARIVEAEVRRLSSRIGR